jgi:hypothetical protein
MKRVIRPGKFFAKAEGKSWKDRAADLLAGKKAKTAAQAKLEIDDRVSGEKLIFPDLGAVSEIVEGVAVTATDGEHIFEADGSVYTVEVKDGIVVSVVEDTTGGEMNEDTQAFVQAVAEELAETEAFKADATARMVKLETDLATALVTISDLKAKMSHKDDRDEVDDKDKKGKIILKGKEIDLSKINLK